MKKLLALVLSLALLLALTACSSDTKTADPTAAPTEEAAPTETDAAPAEEAAAPTETEAVVITVGASVTPHAEILAVAAKLMAEQGYTLNIVEYNDYVLPNTATESGDIDANFFQHTPYLNDFNANNGTHLVPVLMVHYEPIGIYAGKTTSFEELKDGAVVAVPNDGSNEARALKLLEAQGLITLKEGAGYDATVLDIVENPHNLEVKEIEAAQIPRSLPDVDLGVINGNYAIEAGLSIADALATEDPNSDSAQTYGNVLVVKEGNEQNPGILALIEALKSEEVKNFINSTYGGAVVPLF